MFLKLLLMSIGLVGIAFAGLSIKILVQKNGKFPSTSVGGNKYLNSQGIHCVKGEEMKRWRAMKARQINPKDLKISI